jgi:hypothetical protein
MTTRQRQKLAALPKAALIDLVLSLAGERNIARTDAASADAEARRWKRRCVAYTGDVINAERVRADAQTILDAIGPDPDADDHLAELAYAIGKRAVPISHPRRLGPRCRKGRGRICGKPLNEHGLCSRHDARTIRAAKSVAA